MCRVKVRVRARVRFVRVIECHGWGGWILRVVFVLGVDAFSEVVRSGGWGVLVGCVRVGSALIYR